MSDERIFFNCFCYGAAATTWLARMLNSHEDVLCLHTPDYPGADHSTDEHMFAMARFAFDSTAIGGHPYKCVGFTHGLPYTSCARLRQMFGQQAFRGFVMIRNPVVRARSIMALRMQQVSIHKMFQPAESLERFYNLLLEKSGRAGFATDYESLCFYEVCGQLLAAITKEEALGVPVFTMEALTGDPAEVNRLFAYVSDGRCLLDEAAIARVQQRPVGNHARKTMGPKEIFGSWSKDWQDAFMALVGPEERALYRKHGYELPPDW